MFIDNFSKYHLNHRLYQESLFISINYTDYSSFVAKQSNFLLVQ